MVTSRTPESASDSDSDPDSDSEVDSEAAALLSRLNQRFAPVAMANRQLLSVPEPLEPLFPDGGLQQGWSLGVTGHGGWSLALSLIGGSLVDRSLTDESLAGGSLVSGESRGDGWVACVGLEDLGLVAADEIGLRLDRVLMVESPGREHLATVIAALIEAVDVICLGPTPSIGIRDARRLMARAREQNAVLFHLDGGRSWPQPLDVNLSVEVGSWSGMGHGHGRLQSRSMSVTATGRRSMAKMRQVTVLLPGPNGGVASIGEAAPVYGGVAGIGEAAPVYGGVASIGEAAPSRSRSENREEVGEWLAFV